jgi:hypothetical protein
VSAWRGALRAAILITTVLVIAPTKLPAGYCDPDYRVAQWRPASAEPAQDGLSPLWWGITVSAAGLGWLMGASSRKPLPTMDQVTTALNAAFKARTDEADIHSKPKLSKPLEAARRASIGAMKKLLYPDCPSTSSPLPSLIYTTDENKVRTLIARDSPINAPAHRHRGVLP